MIKTVISSYFSSQEQIEKELETFWDRGMKSRLSDLVKDAAEATGLTAREVKVSQTAAAVYLPLYRHSTCM